jgi:hypothetical protein
MEGVLIVLSLQTLIRAESLFCSDQFHFDGWRQRRCDRLASGKARLDSGHQSIRGVGTIMRDNEGGGWKRFQRLLREILCG